MLKKIYDYFIKLADHKWAIPILAIVSFAESSFFPIPPDVLLIPIALARPKKALWAAFVCTSASVLGGLFGYAIGYFLKDSVAMPIIQYFNAEAGFAWFSEKYLEYGSMIVFAAGLTPFPYKVTTIASGLVEMNVMAFVIMSIVSRGLRFFLEAALLYFYGEKARLFIEKNLGMLTIIVTILIFALIYLIKYL